MCKSTLSFFFFYSWFWDSKASTCSFCCSSASTDTAYGKNKADGKWYYFDDSSVSSASEDQIVVRILPRLITTPPPPATWAPFGLASVSGVSVRCAFLLCNRSPPPPLWQTKAAYVLFYQRRDEESPSKPQASASLGGAPDAADDHMDTN